VVSNPVPGVATAFAAALASQFATSTVVYVSLPPGSVPEGRIAAIRVERTGAIVSVPFADGGFDPVAVSASAGDTITVLVQYTGSVNATSVRFTVPASPTSPVIVRTDPPPHKRDVPLNASLRVVFSEPISAASLTGASIQLRSGSELVDGELAFADATHTAVVFTPASVLVNSREYELRITPEIRNLAGTALAGPVNVQFTTVEATLATPSLASVGAGHGFTCGLATDGAVYCWGYAWTSWISGPCPEVAYYDWFPCGGRINPPTSNEVVLTPYRLGGGLKFVSISVGWRHACGITTNGSAYCWGYAAYAQLGDGSYALQSPLDPVAVAGGITFKSISAGDSHTCGVAMDGAAYCWGFNQYGELGNGSVQGDGCLSDNVVCNRPQKVVGNLSFASVSAGSPVTCGLTTAGSAYCWGQNAWGGLGAGTTTGPEQCGGWLADCSTRPVAVAGGRSFTAIAAMSYAACGLSTDRLMYCWGIDNLGVGPTSDDCFPFTVGECSTVPRPIGGGWQFTTLSAAYGQACATTANGAAYCWGSKCTTCISGGAPYDNGWEFVPAPSLVPGGLNFAMVSAGPTSHSCGVTVQGELYCWGDNSAGQLGNGNRTSSFVPVKVSWSP
jgi:alpha-tubulin suppressor-like RCC1 family protein